MGDYISREAAIELAQDMATAIPLPKTVVKEVFNKIPSVDVLEWVPCSERLPEVDDFYLTTNKEYGRLRLRIIHYYEDKKDWYRCLEGYEDKDGKIKTRPVHTKLYPVNVIAWKPLPEPYKGV